MALKPNRIEDPYGQRINYFCNTVVERGGIASLDLTTAAATGDPGDPNAVVAYASDSTLAKPVGVMLYDTVSYDTNRQHDNWYKSGFQARVGMKVTIDKRGQYHTNMIPTGVSPQPGDDAFLADNGLISNVTTSRSSRTSPKVGYWVTAKDASGFAVFQAQL